MTQTPHPAQPGATQGNAHGSKFWDDILSTGIRRDRSRQWFGGVCAGVARRVDVDPVLIRAAVIALTLFGGFGVVVYLVAWLLLPDETGRIMARDALNRDGSADAGGAIALSVIALVVIAAIIFGDNGFLIGWGIIPIAVIGWLVWRWQQGKQQDGQSAWTSASQPGSVPTSPYAASAPSAHGTSQPGSVPSSGVYAASAPSAPAAPSAGVAAGVTAPMAPEHSGPQTAWVPPPAPPVPPRAHLPLAPPPPPRPRRRGAGFAGFALVLGAAVVGYGAGLMLDEPVGFPGTKELLGGIIALAAASLATMIMGLLGRRSLMSATLVILLGLGTAGAAIGEQAWDGEQGIRTWAPAVSSTVVRYDHGSGRTTVDLRPIIDQLANPALTVPPSAAPSVTPTPSVAPSVAPSTQASPAPTATPVVPTPTAPDAAATPVGPQNPLHPQQIEVTQGAGEMRIIVPEGANVQIRAHASFGEVEVRGDLPEGDSDRDRGTEDGPSETLTLNLGSGTPDVIVRADITFGQITIQEG